MLYRCGKKALTCADAWVQLCLVALTLYHVAASIKNSKAQCMMDGRSLGKIAIPDGATNRTTFQPNVCHNFALISYAAKLFLVPLPACTNTTGAICLAHDVQVDSNLT